MSGRSGLGRNLGRLGIPDRDGGRAELVLQAWHPSGAVGALRLAQRHYEGAPSRPGAEGAHRALPAATRPQPWGKARLCCRSHGVVLGRLAGRGCPGSAGTPSAGTGAPAGAWCTAAQVHDEGNGGLLALHRRLRGPRLRAARRQEGHRDAGRDRRSCEGCRVRRAQGGEWLLARSTLSVFDSVYKFIHVPRARHGRHRQLPPGGEARVRKRAKPRALHEERPIPDLAGPGVHDGRLADRRGGGANHRRAAPWTKSSRRQPGAPRARGWCSDQE